MEDGGHGRPFKAQASSEFT